MIKKALGYILFYGIARHLPPAHCKIKPIGKFSKAFRAFCGKLMLVSCGENVNIYNKSRFSTKCELGNNSDIGYKAQINGKCIIGNDVIMGPECQIWTVNHCSASTEIPIKYQGNTEEKPVTIGDGVWIGSRAIILPGVTIGEHSVVGAGAVVSKSIPPYSIAVGNPAKVVKNRLEKMVAE